MDDLISRQAAIDAVKKNTFRLTFAEEQNCDGHVAWSAEAVYSDVMEGALLELSSAKPERKNGKWRDHQEGDWIYAKCSLCGAVQDSRSNFCPHCGAEMEGEGESE